MTEASDALAIARWAWPGVKWSADAPPYSVTLIGDGIAFDIGNSGHLREVERLIVERGLGEQYGRALAEHMDGLGTCAPRGSQAAVFEAIAAARTAPLAAITRALAATIRATKEKE